MLSGVKDIFNDSNKDLKRILKKVDIVNSLENKYAAYSDKELFDIKDYFKMQLENGKSVDDIQADAFAVVREAAKRTLGLRHYDVQLIGGFVLHEGAIAQMNTGEGKTLVSTLPSYLHALEGKGVHIITANEYLAKRDRETMGKIFEFLGLTVGLNVSKLTTLQKKTAYRSDITYGTGNEFGFDYLRDNMVHDKEEKVQRSHNYAIVDEIDSILIDEARTPLIIAGQSNEGRELFQITNQIVQRFQKDIDYVLYPETRNINLTDNGIMKIEKLFGIGNLYDIEHRELLHYINQSLKANTIFKRDIDYIVKDGKIELIDKFTGRIMLGRSLSQGLHQAIEAKENLEITDENVTQATITIQNYFRLYKLLSGMTGSAIPSKKEFWDTYRLQVLTVPTNNPLLREDLPDLIYKEKEKKLKKIVSEVKKIHSTGRPILIGTTSIEQSEILSDYLKKERINHTVLNAKTEVDEAKIIAKAGQHSQIMIATNMAGRGTDIILDEKVKQIGGLYIIGTERHESGRIDMQLRGRAGRQGDPGTSQFIISLEDELFTYYDEEQQKNYLKKVKINNDGLVITPNPHKYLKIVQETVESLHQGARSHLLKLENPLYEQSKIIYAKRDDILEQTDNKVLDIYNEFLENYISNIIENYYENLSLLVTVEERKNIFVERLSLVFLSLEIGNKELNMNKKDLLDLIKMELEQQKKFIQTISNDFILNHHLKGLMLQTIDTNWINHLDNMTNIKEGIGLSGYGQQDPYQLFEKEALDGFTSLMREIESNISINFIQSLKASLKNE